MRINQPHNECVLDVILKIKKKEFYENIYIYDNWIADL
jgi:hypothetical protein